MRRLTLLLVLGSAALLASSPEAAAELTPEARVRVENAIAFLAGTGDASDLDAAARLRTLLDDGKIEVGVREAEADNESMAWAENGVIYINESHVGRPRPVKPTDFSREARQDWGRAFDLAETLVHEMAHIEQGQEAVNESYNRNLVGLANHAELEGWRNGLCASTRWLEGLAAQLPNLPLSQRAELAFRLADASEALNSGIGSFIDEGHLGRFSDFSELGWCRPGGGAFTSAEEGRKFLKDYFHNMRKIETDTLAELDKRRRSLSAASQGAAPQCCLGDGDGPWFCCQWTHPILRKPTCAPGKNRPLCLSYEQGKPVDNADCMEVEPGVAGCKPR